jgi:hypothetical protein
LLYAISGIGNDFFWKILIIKYFKFLIYIFFFINIITLNKVINWIIN